MVLNQSSVAAPERRRKLTGYVMTDSNIRTAVDAWLSNSAAAEATYGHISTWETGGVTDMNCLFVGRSHSGCNNVYNTDALYFNQDISAWDTSGVVTMVRTFYSASSFDQSISNWNVGRVTDMNHMFCYASAFNKPIGNWDVDKVTDMTGMFNRAVSFNQFIGDWKVGAVKSTWGMFYLASSFNQPIGAWSLNSLTKMVTMFCINFGSRIVRKPKSKRILVLLR